MTSSEGHRRSGVNGIISKLALIVCLVSTSLLIVPHTSAAEPTTTIAIGETNNDQERAELLDLFGVVDSDEVATITVEETFLAWEGIFDLSGVDSAYSSTALTCNSGRPGIDVMTSNIEVISPELYALALVTAGMTDAELVVAAPNDAPALGMTALTGVFTTWEQSPCASMGSDPTRRQLALEQLALVAEIGQAHGGPEAVRSATDVVLSLQQAVVGGLVEPDGLSEMVSARAEQLGFPLAQSEAASLVDFFNELIDARLDWGGFASNWTVESLGNGARVMMRPGEVVAQSPTPEAIATGVGGPTRSRPAVSSSPTASAQATATGTAAPLATSTQRSVGVPPPTATETAPIAGAVGPTDTGGRSAGGSGDRTFPWWVLLGLVPLGLGALVLLHRRHRAPLIARQARPTGSGSAAVVRRRSQVPVGPATAPELRTTGLPADRPRFTISGRNERLTETARTSRRVADSRTFGD